MKILITGGAGFIGSHLAERHLDLGDEVYIIDDLSTGSIANIQHLKIHPQFSYHIDSVNNTHLMAELVDLCDVIYHLAAAVGVRLIMDSPVRTIETNIRCTEMVLALAETKRKRVLITSTSEVYGKREQSRSARTMTWCWARPARPAGVTPARRRLTNSWPSPTGKRRECRRSLPACSIRLDRGRPAVTAW